MTDDEVIFSYLKNKSENNLNDLFQKHIQTALSIAINISRNADDAEDIVQHTYFQIFRYLNSSNPKYTGPFKNWLIKITINCAYYHIRHKNKTMKKHQFKAEKNSTMYQPTHDYKDVREALNHISDIYRIPIRLYYYEQMTLKEISDILSRPINTIKSQIHRGLKLLRKRLKEVGSICVLTNITLKNSLEATHTTPDKLMQKITVNNLQSEHLNHLPSLIDHSHSSIHLLRLMGILTILTTTSFLSYQLMNKPTLSPNSLTQHTSTTYLNLNFDDKNDFSFFKNRQGNFQPFQQSQKNYLKISKLPFQTEIVTDIYLPVKANLKFKVASSEKENTLTIGLNKSGPMKMIKNLGVQTYTNQNDFYEYEFYITENYIARYQNYELNHFLQYNKLTDTHLTIEANGANFLIDSIQIETIKATSLPDVSIYINAVNEVVLNKDKNKAKLQHLKAKRGEYVFAIYGDGYDITQNDLKAKP